MLQKNSKLISIYYFNLIKIAKQILNNTLYFKVLLLNVATVVFLSLKQKAGFANRLVSTFDICQIGDSSYKILSHKNLL